MNFLYPSFLWGLAAIAIPIAIHLFNFRKTRKVYFTNVAFLKNVKTSTSSFRNLKHILILAARVLFIAFLVLAFAQPFIPSKSRQAINSQGITSVYMDNSLSMQNELGRGSILDRTSEQVEQLLGVLPNTPSYQLLTNDFESKEQVVISSDKVKDRLTEISFSNLARPLEAVNKRQQNLLNRYSASPKNQVFWFSDFQKSTSGDLSKLQLDSLNQYFIVPVQGEEAANVYIDSLWLATPFVKEMESNELHVRFINTGEDAVDNLSIKLFIDEQQVSTAAVSIASKSPETAVFNFTVQEKGFKRGRISFEDYPVTFDNEYYFVINASPVINVVHLYQGQQSPYIGSVFGNESIFNNKSQNAANLDPSLINTADLVVLDGLSNLDATLSNRLETFVKNGGSLLVFPGAQAEAAAYSQLLAPFGIRSIQKVATTAGSETDTSPSNNLSAPDVQNPFFDAIFEKTSQRGAMNMPYAKPVLQWSSTGTALLRFKNNQPFLSRYTAQKGKVYIAASPLDMDYTSFPKHALFVPVLYKIASQSKTQEKLSYSFQESTIAVEVNGGGKDQVFKLKKDNFEVIPAQRLTGNQLIFELPPHTQAQGGAIPESGYYELSLDGNTKRLLAFNYDKQESDMDVYSPEELKGLFKKHKNVQVFDAVQEGNFINDFKAQNIGRNLWKYCLIAALFFLLVEVALIRLL